MTSLKALRQSGPLLALLIGLLGCHSLKLMPAGADRQDKADKDTLADNKRSFRVGQFLFLPDFDLPENLPLFKELGDLHEQVYKELELPQSNTIIQVHIFEDRDRYDQFMHTKYPFLPNRRAFFVAQPHAVGVGGEDLLVYTYWGDRIREDLRHELTHALLHSVLKEVPLWLDEGLAEYFEVGPEWRGLHARHVEQIRAEGGALVANLTRLEAITQVQQMTSAEYRESWAWVHLMLRDKHQAKVILTQYLQLLRFSTNPGPLKPRLEECFTDPEEALRRHLAGLDPASSSAPTVRRYDD
jgi:hypothetical protein